MFPLICLFFATCIASGSEGGTCTTDMCSGAVSNFDFGTSVVGVFYNATKLDWNTYADGTYADENALFLTPTEIELLKKQEEINQKKELRFKIVKTILDSQIYVKEGNHGNQVNHLFNEYGINEKDRTDLISDIVNEIIWYHIEHPKTYDLCQIEGGNPEYTDKRNNPSYKRPFKRRRKPQRFHTDQHLRGQCIPERGNILAFKKLILTNITLPKGTSTPDIIVFRNCTIDGFSVEKVTDYNYHGKCYAQSALMFDNTIVNNLHINNCGDKKKKHFSFKAIGKSKVENLVVNNSTVKIFFGKNSNITNPSFTSVYFKTLGSNNVKPPDGFEKPYDGSTNCTKAEYENDAWNCCMPHIPKTYANHMNGKIIGGKFENCTGHILMRKAEFSNTTFSDTLPRFTLVGAQPTSFIFPNITNGTVLHLGKTTDSAISQATIRTEDPDPPLFINWEDDDIIVTHEYLGFQQAILRRIGRLVGIPY